MAPFKTSYATNYWSTIIIIALSCIIFEIKQDIGRKSRFFIPPLHSFDTPVRGFPLEYCHSVWCGKNRMVWLPDGAKKQYVQPLRQNTGVSRVTDGRTDGQKTGHLATAQRPQLLMCVCCRNVTRFHRQPRKLQLQLQLPLYQCCVDCRCRCRQ